MIEPAELTNAADLVRKINEIIDVVNELAERVSMAEVVADCARRNAHIASQRKKIPQTIG